jgi:hypothetical protein
MGFRKQSPRPSLSRRTLSRRPYQGEAPEAPLTADPARDEPLCGVKLGRVSVLADGVAFTPLHAGRASGRTVAYTPQAVMTCLCGFAAPSIIMGARRSPRWHEHPVPGDGNCGFYAWKPGQPFQWTTGTWMLDVDLYGRVVEHEHGYRAQKQRVLRISPVPGAFCEPPFSLSYGADDGHITAACPSCPPSPPAACAHPVTPDSLRRLLNVEVDMERAWRLRAMGRTR